MSTATDSPRRPSALVLADKLAKIAETHPDPKVRAAAKRDAEGYRAAVAAKANR